MIGSPTTTGIAIQLNITNIQSDTSRSRPLTYDITIQLNITNIQSDANQSRPLTNVIAIQSIIINTKRNIDFKQSGKANFIFFSINL